MTKADFEYNLNSLSKIKGGFSISDRELIEKLYFIALNKHFKKTTCGDCYEDALIEINIEYKRTKKINKMSNFALKNGVILRTIDIPEIMSFKNTTDELSLKFLNKYPGFIDFFAVYPENWEELAKQVEKEAKKEPKVEEIVEKEAEIEIKEEETKPEIIQGEGTKVTKKVTKKSIYDDNNE